MRRQTPPVETQTPGRQVGGAVCKHPSYQIIHPSCYRLNNCRSVKHCVNVFKNEFSLFVVCVELLTFLGLNSLYVAHVLSVNALQKCTYCAAEITFVLNYLQFAW